MRVPCRTKCVLIGLAGFWLSACHSASAAEVMDKGSTFAEKNASATLHWNLAQNGQTQLVVEDSSGNVVKKDVTGQLTFKPDSGGEAKTVPVNLDTKSGIVSAEGPALDREVTEVRYSLVVGDKPLAGALYVPKQGTAGLVETSKKAALTPAESATHGGSVEVVDGKKYEVVADSESGETRVYLLDPDAKRPKKLKLALESDEPRVVELEWNAEGYYMAELSVQKPPRKTTLVVVDDDDDVHVCLLGFRPGVVVVLDSRPTYWVRRDWHPGLARGHYKGTLDGPPGQVRFREDEPHERIEIKSKGGKGKFKVKGH